MHENYGDSIVENMDADTNDIREGEMMVLLERSKKILTRTVTS